MPALARAAALGLVAGGVSTFWPCAAAAGEAARRLALDRIRARGELRWGADEQGGEPYAYEDPARAARWSGSRSSWPTALARALGVRARFVQNDWSTLVPSLERGSFDVALNGLEVTPARAARVAFTRPYYLFAERLVARAERRARARSRVAARAAGRHAGAQPGLGHAPRRGRRAPSPTRASTSRSSTSRTGASTPCCSTTSSSTATRPGTRRCAVVGDVAEGRYAVARAPRGRRSARGARPRARRAHRHRRAGADPRALRPRRPAPGRRWRRAAAARRAGAPAGARRAHAHQLAALPAGRAGHAADLARGDGAGRARSASLLALARLESRAPAPRSRPPTSRSSAARRCCCSSTSSTSASPTSCRSAPWTAAILGLGLNYAAYEAEIYRAAIQAIPRGPVEAALGARAAAPPRLCRHVVLPQALPHRAARRDQRLHLAAQGQLAGLRDHRRRADQAHDHHRGRQLRGWLGPGLLCAALYFALSYPLSRLARRLERRMRAAGAGEPGGRRSPASRPSRRAWRNRGARATESPLRVITDPDAARGGQAPRVRSQRRARDHAAAAGRADPGAGARARRGDGGGRAAPVQRAGAELLAALAAFYGVPVPPLRVLGVRPHRVTAGVCTYQLFGDYTPSTHRIRVWMRTAIREQVSSPKALLNTLLHEFCHHLDCTRLACPESYHTRGFFTRIDHLYHLALATPPESAAPAALGEARRRSGPSTGACGADRWLQSRAPPPAAPGCFAASPSSNLGFAGRKQSLDGSFERLGPGSPWNRTSQSCRRVSRR